MSTSATPAAVPEERSHRRALRAGLGASVGTTIEW